ncbi:carbon-nitrogen hydrolase family protein [Streptomyces cinnamoneus]|uniref:Carbon-nitrogen hydrolase family protein n=1 Tax=Streptomyces cinnamoneus TaxID=53446 RepID=A0A2G1XG03_STRCJ|nr:carbon-nitrogen hydrolase family protein [Streptomyces cinnamoneus]PHQ50168.1 carbon-nitrogen hydrolase family protein [Streptomyces cinnamoneus]PPT13048.1 carbon-nitrogen hydrolase family protein [Streptomyces cinnamoneus]
MIIAAAQFTARPLDVTANVARMAAVVTEAGERGAALVVFPELAVTGYELAAVAADPDRLAVDPDDPRLGPLRDACRAAGVAAVVNCAGRLPAGPTISSFVYGPDGAPLTRYEKQHVTAAEEAAGFVAGTRDGRFTLGGVAFGLAICFDAHFPDLAARAAADGCSVLLASSLYGRGGGAAERMAVFPSLARDNGLYVVLANHVGPAGPYDACGLSAVWGPDGEVLAEGPGDDTALVPARTGVRAPGAVAG